MLLDYWPIFAFAFSLFIGSIGVAIGSTLWLAGKLAEQDAKRIEVKEAILKEVRERSHTLYGRLDQQNAILDEKIDELSERVTRLEAAMENLIRDRYTTRRP